jgi:hypothetical protein
MMRSMKTLLSMLAVAAVLAGCGGGSSSSSSNVNTLVRLVNVSPATDNVKVTLAGVVATSSLAYHDATGYVSVASGTPELTVYSATTGASLYDVTNLSIASGSRNTIFVYGGGTSVTATLLPDDTTAASAGHVSLRLSHSATGIGTIDLYLLPAGTAIRDATPAYSALAYAATTVFAEYASGTYSIILTPAGTKEVIYDSGAQTLSDTGRITLLVFGTGSGKLANVALLQDDGSGATAFVDNRHTRFRFVNAHPDTQAADVLVDGSVAFAGVPSGGLSAYGLAAAGARAIKVQASSAPGAYLYDGTRNLNAGVDYSLVVYGAAGGGPASLLALQDNNLPPASGMAKLRFVNAVSDGTAYDAYTNDAVVLTNMGFATASPYQSLAAGTFSLGYGPTGTGQQAVRLSGQQLDAGHVYTIYLYGRGASVAAVLAEDD